MLLRLVAQGKRVLDVVTALMAGGTSKRIILKTCLGSSDTRRSLKKGRRCIACCTMVLGINGLGGERGL
jgi:hypothetical protein